MLLYEPEPTTSQKSMGKFESSMEALRPSGCLRHLELCKDVAIRAGTHHFAEVDGRFGRWARSEERRVGKEWRVGGRAAQWKTKTRKKSTEQAGQTGGQ